MKDTIYLVFDKHKVVRMVKSIPATRRDELFFKLNINVDDKAFEPLILEQSVVIESWHKGIDIEDVHLKKNVITEEEAEMIRSSRLQKMKQILEGQGYSVEKVNEDVENE